MAAPITSDVLEAFLHCKFKAHLKLTGQQGVRSDYEAMLLEMRADVRLAAIEIIVSKSDDVERGIALTTAALKRGAAYILDATLDDLHFDGLKRVDGPSKLGDFHYVPMLCRDA
jgi:hypothetical protein